MAGRIRYFTTSIRHYTFKARAANGSEPVNGKQDEIFAAAQGAWAPFVKSPIGGGTVEIEQAGQVHFMAWTTTPWTLSYLETSPILGLVYYSSRSKVHQATSVVRSIQCFWSIHLAASLCSTASHNTTQHNTSTQSNLETSPSLYS